MEEEEVTMVAMGEALLVASVVAIRAESQAQIHRIIARHQQARHPMAGLTTMVVNDQLMSAFSTALSS